MTRTLGRQVLLGYLASLVATVLIVLLATVALRDLSERKDSVIDVDAQLVMDAYRLKSEMLHESLEVRAYLLSGDEDLLAAAEPHAAEFARLLDELERHVRDEEGAAAIERLRRQRAEYAAVTEQVIEARRDGTTGAELGELSDGVLVAPRQAIVATVDELVERQERRIAGAIGEADERAAGALALVWLLGLAAILLALGIARWLTRRIERRLGTLAQSIGTAADELLAATSQQVAGASEQASAVQETVATTDELTQSAEETAQRANDVAANAQRSADTAEAGREAVDRSIEGMASVQTQVETIAAGILTLAERAQAISEITRTVRDLADQTNVLALNASIEAARAGDEGRGFAVVATEVRSLAEESQRATDQVAGILGEIQQATNQAVMSTEEGTKRVAEGRARIEAAGSTIEELARTIQEAASSAEQIAASAGQQAGATMQIGQAMRDVNEVVDQGLVTARQSERTAKDLSGVAADLRALSGIE